MRTFFDFEKPIAELEGKIEELRHLADDGDHMNIAEEVSKLQAKADRLLTQTYAKLGAWQKVQVARHHDRPHFADYVGRLLDDFIPLAGDRGFAEDRAIIGGIGRLRGHSVMLLGHEKGADTEGRVAHNFGMARPEGYHKSRRLMDMADRFKLPVVTLIDTPGAYPGIGAEERGQAGAIARAMQTCLRIRVPLISVIIGEGGSGGAIALATGDRILMLEHAIYSVISPEGCAAILWRSADQAQAAAEALKITAQDLLKLKVIDEIIEEPLGGAHRNHPQIIDRVGDAVERQIFALRRIDGGKLRANRREKFLAMGREGLQ